MLNWQLRFEAPVRRDPESKTDFEVETGDYNELGKINKRKSGILG